MTEDEFRLFAKKKGYTAPEFKTQPPNAFFDQHAHKDDLIHLFKMANLSWKWTKIENRLRQASYVLLKLASYTRIA